MSSITIHDIDEALNERLSAEARRRKTSKNALIKELLATGMGLPVNGVYADDYHEFLGLWTAEEYETFRKTQEENERIDNEEWDEPRSH